MYGYGAPPGNFCPYRIRIITVCCSHLSLLFCNPVLSQDYHCSSDYHAINKCVNTCVLSCLWKLLWLDTALISKLVDCWANVADSFIWIFSVFDTEASFGLWVLSLPTSVCVCVHVSVCQPWACLCDNLWPIQARIIKFGPEVQNNLIKIPFVFGGWLTLTVKVKFNLKVKISLCPVSPPE